MKVATELNKCFVLMPFSAPFNEYYHEVYQPAVKATGLQPLRADEISGVRPFIDDIIESIKTSAVILADITGRNPNVVYEMGYAYAIGKPLIILSQSVAEVPSDIRHQRVIIYKTTTPDWPMKLRSEITDAIEKVLREQLTNSQTERTELKHTSTATRKKRA